MSKQISLSVLFDGDAVKEGIIDVKELAPALLSLSEILTDSNKLLGNDFDISLNVKSVSQGSFEVDLIVAVSGFINDMVNIFSSDEINALVNLLEVLGLGGGLYGLIKMIKKSKGKKPVQIKFIKENNIVVFVFEDESIEAPKGTEILYQNRKIRENLKKFFHPLEKKGIDKISIKEQEEQITIHKGEEVYFNIPEEITEILLDRSDEKIFQIINLWFKEENKWRLYDGENTYNVVIKDEGFLRNIDRNIEMFAKGSLLKVQLRTLQYRKGIELHTDYEIIRVIDHIKPPEQLSLLNE